MQMTQQRRDDYDAILEAMATAEGMPERRDEREER
jgi:hypothetical protein